MAFNNLKNGIESTVTNKIDQNLPFGIKTNTLNVTLSDVLSQKDQLDKFFSRILLHHQQVMLTAQIPLNLTLLSSISIGHRFWLFL